MLYLKCKSYFVGSEVYHIHECLVSTKGVAEELVNLWQDQRGPTWRWKIEELKEANPRNYKNLGLYKSVKEFILPNGYPITKD